MTTADGTQLVAECALLFRPTATVRRLEHPGDGGSPRDAEGQSLEPGADGIPAHPALAGESGAMPTPP